MKDMLVVGGGIVAFAFLVTVHAAIALGLVQRRPRWRALAALVVIPLAPWLAFRERMRIRAVMWLVGAVGYAVALVLMYTAR